MKAYKLLSLKKDGSIGSLFINKRARLPIGEWMEAEDHPTKGYAHRKGWHCMLKPDAPHLTEKGRVWAEVEVDEFEYFDRPESQGGRWVLAQKMKIVELFGAVKDIPIVDIQMVKDKEIPYGKALLTGPTSVAELFRLVCGRPTTEKVMQICLGTDNRPTFIRVVSSGTLNHSVLHPREIFQAAILSNSNSTILVHNHPSGRATPSEDDKSITKQIEEAGKLMGIRLLDHVIVGDGDNVYSFQNAGLIS